MDRKAAAGDLGSAREDAAQREDTADDEELGAIWASADESAVVVAQLFEQSEFTLALHRGDSPELGARPLVAHIELFVCVLPQSRQTTIIRSRFSSALTPTEMASCL